MQAFQYVRCSTCTVDCVAHCELCPGKPPSHQVCGINMEFVLKCSVLLPLFVHSPAVGSCLVPELKPTSLQELLGTLSAVPFGLRSLRLRNGLKNQKFQGVLCTTGMNTARVTRRRKLTKTDAPMSRMQTHEVHFQLLP